MNKIYTLPLIFLIAGCATNPSDITPTYVSGAGYTAMSCSALSREADNVSSMLVLASKEQENAANFDATMVTVSAVLFWPAALFTKGDGMSAANVAKLKGEMRAIREASEINGCGL